MPFKGGAPATIATVAGDTMAMFAGSRRPPQIRPASCVRLQSPGTRRSPEFPDLPTIAEFYPGYEVTIWLGLFAPAGTPEPVLVRLRAAVRKPSRRPTSRQSSTRPAGSSPSRQPPTNSPRSSSRDYDKYGKIVKDDRRQGGLMRRSGAQQRLMANLPLTLAIGEYDHVRDLSTAPFRSRVSTSTCCDCQSRRFSTADSSANSMSPNVVRQDGRARGAG